MGKSAFKGKGYEEEIPKKDRKLREKQGVYLYKLIVHEYAGHSSSGNWTRDSICWSHGGKLY